MKICKTKKNILCKRGFILLFAVTLSSILLSIALGISNIAFKEASFNTSARDSNDAFLASDTGAECALFNDKLVGGKFPIAGPATSITCAGQTITPTFSGTATTGNYDFNILTSSGISGSTCAKVNVFKDKSVSPTKVVITSSGYNIGDSNCNSTNIHRVEREFIVTSTAGTPPTYQPPASSVDLKCNGADSCSVVSGSPATLSWSTSASITSCTATTNGSWSGSKTWPTGSQTLSGLTSTQTYSIQCTSAQGTQAQDSVTVTVTAPVPTKCLATGGTVTTSGIYTVHTFTTTSNPKTFSQTCSQNVEYLVVAGGGGGAWGEPSTYVGGGGGGGGMKTGTISTPNAGDYTITIGNGGSGAAQGVVAGNGGPSSIVNSLGTVISSTTGGGGGGEYNVPVGSRGNGAAGGSGGGAGSAGSKGSGNAGEGYAGGEDAQCATYDGGGAGGGAGGAGNNGTCNETVPPTSRGGIGGVGSLWPAGSSTYYAGGGGGSGVLGGTASHGGGAKGVAGTVNTGGGGGGGNSGSGRNGGTGIVIIRYIYP